MNGGRITISDQVIRTSLRPKPGNDAVFFCREIIPKIGPTIQVSEILSYTQMIWRKNRPMNQRFSRVPRGYQALDP